MKTLAIIALALGLAFIAPYCGAQGEDAYPRMVAEAAPEPPSGAAFPADDPLPPPQKVEARQGHWWARLVPSDRSIWLLSSLADIGQYSYAEVDAMTTQHIKSGKGIREARLAVKMLVGAGETGSLVGEFHKGKHAKKKR